MRVHLDEANPQKLPHAIEAVRQISGDMFTSDEANEFFGRAPQPHLLHEPYMSAEGAKGMLGQTLADVIRKVDQEAEACGTLESPEFDAFRALVSSVYVGSLQKRVDYVENKERLQVQVSENASERLPQTTPHAGADHGGQASNPDEPRTRRGGTGLSTAKQQHRDQRHCEGRTDDGRRSGGGGGYSDSSNDKPGIARSGHQACSGDIAQALVAIAMGEGFEHFTSTSIGGDEASARTKGGSGKVSSDDRAQAKGRRGGVGGGARGVGREAEGLAEAGDGNKSSRAQQQLRQQERDYLVHAAAELQYLSENATILRGGRGRGGEERGGLSATEGSVENARSEGAEGRFPGLQWLAPYIIGRSIPMELRYCVLHVVDFVAKLALLFIKCCL